MKKLLRRLQSALVVASTPVIAAATTCFLPINWNTATCETDFCDCYQMCPVFGECMELFGGYAGCGAALQLVQCEYLVNGYQDEKGCCIGGVSEVPPRYSDIPPYVTYIAVPLGDVCATGEG